MMSCDSLSCSCTHLDKRGRRERRKIRRHSSSGLVVDDVLSYFILTEKRCGGGHLNLTDLWVSVYLFSGGVKMCLPSVGPECRSGTVI